MENEDESPYNFRNVTLIDENLLQIVQEKKDSLAENSDLYKLLVQYIDMYDLLLLNLHSERLGDWEGLKLSLRLMLPFFCDCRTTSVYKMYHCIPPRVGKTGRIYREEF